MASRIVLHLDMDAFFAACEMARRPELKDKAVVIGADPRQGIGRGVVTTANYAARKFGIKSAMPIAKAWELAGGKAVFLPTDHAYYSQVSRAIFNGLHGWPLEQTSVDEGYIDLSDRCDWSNAEEEARRVKDRVRNLSDLTCSVGIGPNKLVAKIASDFQKPDGLTRVPPHEVQAFLDPLGVRKIPGIGPKTEAALRDEGVSTIEELRRLSLKDLTDRFGSHGAWMHQAARGIDDAPVNTHWEPNKSISQEHTFDDDVSSRAVLLAAMRRMMDDLEKELEGGPYWWKTVAVKIRYEDFDTFTRQASIPHHARDTWAARRLAPRLLDELLQDPRPVRLVGLRLSDLQHAPSQTDLPQYTRLLGEAGPDPPRRRRGQQRFASEP